MLTYTCNLGIQASKSSGTVRGWRQRTCAPPQPVRQGGAAARWVVAMLTIAPLKRWSIDYYNQTARAAGQDAKDAAAANGGLGEYYSEKETRAPVWLRAGDAKTAAELAGLSDADRAGGQADPDVVARWLDDGIAPNGA